MRFAEERSLATRRDGGTKASLEPRRCGSGGEDAGIRCLCAFASKSAGANERCYEI